MYLTLKLKELINVDLLVSTRHADLLVVVNLARRGLESTLANL